MKSKTFSLTLTPAQLGAVAEAWLGYADAAYPPGASECAQVARSTLLASADALQQQANGGPPAPLRRRQRAILKAAVAWYYSEEGPGNPADASELLSAFP